MKSKVCSLCKKKKPISYFNKKSSREPDRKTPRTQPYCKFCQSEYQKAYYKKNHKHMKQIIFSARRKRKNELRKWIGNYFLTHPCVDCGETDIRVLEFDHVRGRGKDFSISYALHLVMPMAQLQAEVKKCVVRCANHHNIKTSNRSRDWRYKFHQKQKKPALT